MAANSAKLLMWITVVAFSTHHARAQSRAVDLSDAFSIGPQEGFQRVHRGRYVDGELVESDYARDLAEIEKLRTGASNVFLVDATNLKDAMNASWQVLTNYGPAGPYLLACPTLRAAATGWSSTWEAVTAVHRSGSLRESPWTRTVSN
jgi:hypothetical protein